MALLDRSTSPHIAPVSDTADGAMGTELIAGDTVFSLGSLGRSAARLLGRLVRALVRHAVPGDGAWNAERSTLDPSTPRPELHHDRNNH